MFVFVFLCCVVLCTLRPLQRADHSSKGVLPSVLLRSWNLRCEAAEVLTRIVEPLMTISLLEITCRRFRGAYWLHHLGHPETTVNFYQTTWRNTPEDRQLHTSHSESPKSHHFTFHYKLHMKQRDTAFGDYSYHHLRHVTKYKYYVRIFPYEVCKNIYKPMEMSAPDTR
jgi:hypothetical protein